MAAAPKCKICGSAHWANQPHAFSAPKPASPKVETIRAAVPIRASVPTDAAARLAAFEAKDAARKTKLAAYMRTYRAKKAK